MNISTWTTEWARYVFPRVSEWVTQHGICTRTSDKEQMTADKASRQIFIYFGVDIVEAKIAFQR